METISLLNVVLSVGIAWDKRYETFVIIEATKFDANYQPISWAIRRSGYVMSKSTGVFIYEPRPSSRTDEFFDEYRFSSVEEARLCWNKFYQ